MQIISHHGAPFLQNLQAIMFLGLPSSLNLFTVVNLKHIAPC
jgi:hypothetical protein